MSLDNLGSVQILALTIWGEARGEEVEGQIAVGNVIANRSFKQNKPIKDICLAPKQFSCWNDSDPNKAYLLNMADDFNEYVRKDKTLKQCYWIAQGIVSSTFIDNTRDAHNYMTVSLFNSPKRPSWASAPKNTHIIGQHIFFSV